MPPKAEAKPKVEKKVEAKPEPVEKGPEVLYQEVEGLGVIAMAKDYGMCFIANATTRYGGIQKRQK